MKAFVVLFVSSFIALLSVISYASVHTSLIDELSWTLRKDANSVEVYTADVESSRLKAILSITTVNAAPERVMHYMRDLAACAQWVHRCKRSHLHDQISEQEDYVYTAKNMPFMAKDGDILAHLT